ncbi:hypothetical protein EV2_048451 [Malus domestica]
MESSKGQAVFVTTKGKILSISTVNGHSVGSTTAPQHAADLARGIEACYRGAQDNIPKWPTRFFVSTLDV